jgi:hypothetical protein
MSSQEGLSPWSDGIQQVLNYVDSSYFPGHLLGPKQEGMDVMANELTLCTDPRAYSCQSDSLSAGQLRLHAKKWWWQKSLSHHHFSLINLCSLS